MKNLLVTIVVGLCLTASGMADDLHKVTLHSHQDALALRAIEADVLLGIRGGYLVLADAEQSEALVQSGLDIELLTSNVYRDQLALDRRQDRQHDERFEVLYEEGQLRLLLVGADQLTPASRPAEVFPLRDQQLRIMYQPLSEAAIPETALLALDNLEDLISGVEQDSLESYVLRLEAFYQRMTGTDSNYAARDWIVSKFYEFGYDSVMIDPFIGERFDSVFGDGAWKSPCQSYNVIAVKEGAVLPDLHIIVGGHFDSFLDCPGADDNASGTAAVLEIARVLKDVETDMTVIFIAFDSEESWMWGSYHYVDSALERNDDIVLMINADMIAHITNSHQAFVNHGAETAYAGLWDQLANTYAGIDGYLDGSAPSDHYPFQQAGYDVIGIKELFRSTHYHLPSDSAVYLNFEYMTRMVQATLATLYTVDQHPPPIRITSVQEPGDGQSQLVTWQQRRPPVFDSYRLSYYPSSIPQNVTSIDLPPTKSSYTVEGLTEGQEYAFYVQAYDSEGRTSFAYDPAYGTPCSIPVAPFDVFAIPLHQAVQITWSYINAELDFHHCAIIRDGEVIGETLDTVYVDDDPSLGSDLHYYYITAVDTDGNHSDTVGVEPFWMKAAALEPDRVLAVNRTSVRTIDFVDETETGAFIREALEGYNFDYYSDTAATINPFDTAQLDLIDMVDYGVMVIGSEAGRYDDIGVATEMNGLLDTLAYYMSIGGKVVIFGRWGDLGPGRTIDYLATPANWDNPYHDLFHIDYRVLTPTLWEYIAGNFSTFIDASLVGARSKDHNYPHLVWDSLATVAHSTAQDLLITDVSGIPCASWVELSSDETDVVYTYDGRLKSQIGPADGKPVAWRYLGPDYAYIYFDIPLSFFERTSAIAALQRAVDELMSDAGIFATHPTGDNTPGSFALSQNYPNPFNPATEIFYSLPDRAHVKLNIYNILGQKVSTVVDEEKSPGRHTVQWYGTDDTGARVATGIYFYEIRAGEFAESKKMLLLK